MLALVIFGILIAYLALAVVAVRATVRSARAADLTMRQRWWRGGLVALVFYLIPFWDWIPTVAAHQYYCATEAKFEVFKTIEQWKKENAEVVPTLRYDANAKSTQIAGYKRFPLNQRIASERKSSEEMFLSVKRESAQIIDLMNSEVLARYVEFRAGYAPLGVGGEGAWKFWLKRSACDDSEGNFGSRYAAFSSELTSLGKERK